MTAILIEEFSASWSAAGPWVLAVEAGYISSSAMEIVANGGSMSTSLPFAQREYSPALDMSNYDELRFWFRSSHRADGSPTRPFYLSFEADTIPSTGTWSRLIPILRTDTWEPHRLWLADMPDALRSAVGVLRLRSLNPETAFVASIDQLVATRPEPIQDVETALHERLHEQFQVKTGINSAVVPAVFDLPEIQQSTDMPFIQITPWSLRHVPAENEGGELIDNFTPQGPYVRPTAERLSLQYMLDVVASERVHKTYLFEQILRDWMLEPYLIVGNERLEITLFVPPGELLTGVTAARRTPIFCEITTEVDVVPRLFQPWAVPLIHTAPLDGRDTAELTIP